MMRQRLRIMALGSALAAGSIGVPAARALVVAPDSPGCALAPAPSVGIAEVGRTVVTPRLVDVTVHSQAMRGDQHVDVLLPNGYDDSGATRYPVLFLLHGSFGKYSDWATNGVADLVGDLPLIVVMPDDGIDGSYSDWYGTVMGTTDVPPAWETYHLRELVPFVDATFPTIGTRAGRFIAGLSSGGAGTMKYAAANPGLFAAAGSFSGAVNTDVDYPFYPIISEGLWGITALPTQGPDGHCTWGDPFTQHVIWLDNDPTYLAQNLEGTALFLACGDGNPGELDGSSATYDPVEGEVWTMNQRFGQALDAADIAHMVEFYGHGTHTWPYWKRDFTHFLTWLEPQLTQPLAPPAAFSYRSARPSFSAWDWSFRPQRDVREFTYLRDVSAAGFGVTGSGALHVTSAPVYAPNTAYTVTAGGGPRPVVSDGAGRLHFTIDLGPSHAVQQYRFGAKATSHWVTLQVVIAGS
jgi:S-formylglutathione hydrolase FrmB